MLQTRSSRSIARRIRSHRVRFWVRRYLPPEIVGMIAMLLAAQLAALITASAPIIALSAVLAGAVGCSATLGATVYREQWTLWGGDVRPRAWTVVRITARLLAAEFGAIGLVDLVVLRPAFLLGGILIVGNITGGLIIGKIAADAIFYAVAAVAFTVTSRKGLREVPAGRSARPASAVRRHSSPGALSPAALVSPTSRTTRST